jgi:phage terminase large subunit-like protein
VPFSEEKADRAVKFIETQLRHGIGQYAGKPFLLRDFQRKIIRDVFGTVDDDGNRRIRTVFIEIPKKSGKSALAAAVALKLLYADGESGAEIYGAAADRDQASIVFNVAASMVRRNPKLLSRSKIIDSTKRILVPQMGSYYRALSAEVAGKHGFNSHGVIFDEVHAQRDRRLWEVLTFGAGDARRQPLVFAITTAGIPGESPVAEELHDYADQILRGVIPPDPSFYPVIYSAPADEDWTSEEVWRSCNPALGDFLNIESVRSACERAKRMPSEQNSFRRLRLNQWVKQETRWIDLADWDRCAGDVDIKDFKDMACYGGLDLSTTTDLSAFVLLFKDENGNHYAFPHFWIPEANVRRSAGEALKLAEWVRRGFIHTTPGNVIDYDFIRKRVNELGEEFRIRQIAHDPWNATQLAIQLAGDGFEMVATRQGFASLSAPTKELERLVLDGRLRHGGHPVLRWMADCCSVKQDAVGNIKLVKPDRQKSSKRIDGISALVMAVDRCSRNENRPSVYDTRGVLVI